MTDDTIIFTNNYYHDIDPHDYYKDGKLKAAKAVPIRPLYVSDLIDQDDCVVNFGRYRNKDDKSANQIIKSRQGIVRGYNPKTNLLKIHSKKKNPSLKKFDKKIRYVAPEDSTVNLSVHGREGRSCRLTQTKCKDKPDCIMHLNHLVKEYQERYNKFMGLTSIPPESVKTVKGAGRRSRRNSKKQVRTSQRRLF